MIEKSKSFDKEVQVGIFVILACLIFVTFSMNLTNYPLFKTGNNYTIFLKDAVGIYKNTKVKIAGISVGSVVNVELEDGKAKIVLLIDKGIIIPKDAVVVPQPVGILGDKFLDISIPEMYKESSSLDLKNNYRQKVLNYITNNIYQNIYAQQNRESFKRGDTLPAKSNQAGMDEIMGKIGEASENLKKLSNDMNDIVGRNKGEISSFIQSINRVSHKMEKILTSVEAGGLKEDIKALSKAAGNLGESLENLKIITAGIKNGKGTVGQLVNETETIDNINLILSRFTGTVERAANTEILVNSRLRYNISTEEFTTDVGLDLFSSESFGYRLGITLDSEGSIKKETKKTTVSGVTSVEEIETKDSASVAYNFQLVKKIYYTQFRVGVFESKGGIGFDLNPVDWISMSLDAFDFSRDDVDAPKVNLYLGLNVLRYLNIFAGLQDAFNEKNKELPFHFGVRLKFNDRDLKGLLFLAGGV